MGRLHASSVLLLNLLLVCLGAAGISAFIGARATHDASSTVIYRPSEPSMPGIDGQDAAKDASSGSAIIPTPPAGVCVPPVDASSGGPFTGAYSDTNGTNVTVCPASSASFLASGNASAETQTRSASELQRLLGRSTGVPDAGSPAETKSDAVTVGETVPVTGRSTMSQAEYDNATFERQWEVMVSGMGDYANDLAFFAKGVRDEARVISAGLELWGVRTCGLFPYNAPVASAAPKSLVALPAYTDDVSSYAGAMSDYTNNLAEAAAGLGGRVESFLAYSDSLKKGSDWSSGPGYTEYMSFMTGEVKFLAKWASDLAAFATDWVDNVEYQSLVYQNSTVVNIKVLTSAGELVSMDDSARELVVSAKDLSEFAAEWTTYAADMDLWAADWVSHAFNYGLCQTKAAAMPAGTFASQ